MKRVLFCALMAAVSVIGLRAETVRAITFHTSIYEQAGSANEFSLLIGGSQAGTIYVDCGNGKVKYDLVEAGFDPDTQAITGTIVDCSVTEEGNVTVYCDEPARIEYFNGTGCYIRNITFDDPEALYVLSLEHNELEALDMSRMTALEALYLSDNPFNVEPMMIAGVRPELQILDMSIIENVSPDFDFRNFPALLSVDAMSCATLTKCDVSQCPGLLRLSIDNTMVSELDVTKNPELLILNISETAISSIDLSKNAKLEQFYATHQSAFNQGVKLTSVNFSNNPKLKYIFLTDNALTTLDCSDMTSLQDLYVAKNRLTSLNIDNCPSLLNVDIHNNRLNFNTMPVPSAGWNEFYGNQSPIDVGRSVKVGAGIDLTAEVVRAGTTTLANVYYVPKAYPEEAYEVSSSKWTYANGCVTFKEAIADSVYVTFTNDLFPDVLLRTANFKVKTAEEWGKAEKRLSFTPIYAGSGDEISFGIGVDGATAATPKTVYVDFGDGNLREYSITAHNGAVTTISGTKPGYGAVSVWVKDDLVITDLAVEDIPCSAVDISALTELRYLTLRGLELYKLDTGWNRCLVSMTVTGNHFSQGLSIAGVNGWFTKNVLRSLDLSNNEFAEYKIDDLSMLWHLDLSNNRLTGFNLKDCDWLQTLNLSGNLMEDVDLSYGASMTAADLHGNRLKSVTMPETNVLQTLDVSDNALTYVTLPHRGDIAEENYLYAPQAQIVIATKSSTVNLSAQALDIDGNMTQFAWKTADGTTLTPDVDYTIDNGVTLFLAPAVGKKVYCEITNAAYPKLAGTDALTTTVVEAADAPTCLIGSFVTTTGGQTAELSMRGLYPGAAVYIDWTGTHDLVQYELSNETYTAFTATTTEGATVGIYSYDAEPLLAVFSLSGVSLKDVDVSGMNGLTTLAFNNAGLADGDLKMPAAATLVELFLEGNKFTSFDFTPFTSLQACSLAANSLSSIDISPAKQLGTLSLANNSIADITIDNPKLWALYLTKNQLETIDLSGAPELYQVFLNGNKLKSVDLDGFKQLRVVIIDHNEMDFATLPLPRDQWTYYVYGDQAPLQVADGKTVDLSRIASRDGYATSFLWYDGIPVIDPSEGTIEGYLLEEGTDYTIEGGVTTFAVSLPEVSGFLMNDAFPSMYMTTNAFATTDSGLDAIDAGAAQVSVEGLAVSVSGLADDTLVTLVAPSGAIVATARAAAGTGTARLSAPAPGIYLLAAPALTAKLALR
ncbi:MAG: hypothetical protein HUK14_03825 [Muribaculaceae bacterium]|nr:hypothetical protein [Muribaculaceae bacterium]